jgi:hypothetical protein
MIDIASINRTFPAAFAKIMPSRTPVASCCKTLHCRQHSPLLNPQCRCVFGTPPTTINYAVAIILVTLDCADRQIPIVPRRC